MGSLLSLNYSGVQYVLHEIIFLINTQKFLYSFFIHVLFSWFTLTVILSLLSFLKGNEFYIPVAQTSTLTNLVLTSYLGNVNL
jgi:hypothetical protein